jgi:hypothetical protein
MRQSPNPRSRKGAGPKGKNKTGRSKRGNDRRVSSRAVRIVRPGRKVRDRLMAIAVRIVVPTIAAAADPEIVALIAAVIVATGEKAAGPAADDRSRALPISRSKN